jgi:pyridoxal phosphate enzyme (YggS family)
MDTIGANLQAVKGRIATAAQQCGRAAASIDLLAVSKTFGADAVRAAHAAGQRAFGENYVQEAVGKIAALAELGLTWHFIGPIQSNKTSQIAAHFDWAHSVDRLKIAERLSAARPAGHAPLQVCLQVNIGGEDSKSGVAPAALPALARAVAALPRLQLRGLMTIPPASAVVSEQRGYFAQLRRLRETLAAAGIITDTLSMGMSSDLEAAIAEGATLVRVGTAIFGARHRA